MQGMIKAIAFDFDGVIVDSNRLKYEAWFRIFPESEGVSHELVRDVLLRIKQTRYDILQEIFNKLGRTHEQSEQFVATYAMRYNKVVQDAIALGGLIPGVRETLVMLSQHYAIYINSATPETALREAVMRGGIEPFIKKSYGTPASKEENLAMIIEREGIDKEGIVMVGDGEGDFHAARAIGCFFIGVRNESNNWSDKEFPLVTDLRQIEKIIAENV